MLTPLKLQPSFAVAQDEEDDVVTKIPHGLTAKRNRRKSYHTERTESFALSPLRAPLTAPRPNMLNPRVIMGSGTLENTKRSLMPQLNSMTDGKENHTPMAMTPIKIDEIEVGMSSPVARMTHKRRSSNVEDADDAYNVTKIQKINELLAEACDVDNDIVLIDNKVDDLFEQQDDEELSRIELVVQEDIDSSVIVPTQEDLVQQDKERSSITDAKISNLVDNLELPMDDHMSLTPQRISFEKPSLNFVENISVSGDDAPISPHKKHASLASPNKKPYFTISQVHEIQADFKNEVETLKKSLQGKSSLVLELNEEISQLKNGVYQLEDEVKSLSLEKRQLSTDNDLLQAEHSIYKQNVTELEETIQGQDSKIERHKMVISKFQERLRELNSIVASKEQELETMKAEIDSKSRAVSFLNERVSDFEKQAQTLSVQFCESQEKLEQSTLQTNELSQEKDQLQTTISQKDLEAANLVQVLEQTQKLLKESQDSKDEILAQFNNEEQSLKDAEVKYFELINKITTLESQISTLQAGAEQERSLFNVQVQELNNTTNTQNKQIMLQKVIIDALRSAVNTLNSSLLEYKQQTDAKTMALSNLSHELAEAKDLLIVKTAEVDELTVEIKESSKLIEESNRLVGEIEDSNDELSAHVTKLTNAVNSKDLELRGLREEIQKQETDHLTELEAFHSELSNVQSMVSNKSNELFKLKEEKEQGQRKYELLKYEYDTMKEEAGDYETRLSTLKSKLHEYKEHVQNLENLVKSEEEEKQQLEKDTDKRLQQLAEDLYIQYSKKHEQKVQVLKKGYESKWQAKVSKAEIESERLRSEIEGLKAQLGKEKLEKTEIIKLWDQFKEQGQE